uniref:Uncharacterized protein n=1 Tax=Cyanistes caeruleus TaxID=156563 RepID=A0A8C0UZH6_CYACU
TEGHPSGLQPRGTPVHSECGKRFPRSSGLINVSGFTQRRGPSTALTVGRASQNCTLIRHQHIHTGERPYDTVRGLLPWNRLRLEKFLETSLVGEIPECSRGMTPV